MRVLWITALVVLIDQTAKVIVLNTMYLGQSIPLIGDWLRLTFTENPGMAFGITFGPRALVTILSLIATALIIIYMVTVRRAPWNYRASLCLILGGAIGNIIDRVFYGVLLGYDTFFVGRVVDFIHVNMWRGYIAEGIPIIGGSYIALFPIWNVADMAIVAGVVGILLFQEGAARALSGDAPRDESSSVQATRSRTRPERSPG
jgi:signal peptidase II